METLGIKVMKLNLPILLTGESEGEAFRCEPVLAGDGMNFPQQVASGGVAAMSHPVGFQEPAPGTKQGLSPMETRTILVAEDREDDVFLIQRAFKRAGSKCSLQFVPNGEEALAYLRAERDYADRRIFPAPDLLLLDLKMPKKNGLEVLEVIRADPKLKKLTVIVFTSSDQPRDIDLALELGANSYLVKPSGLEALVGLMQRLEDYWLNLSQRSLNA